MMQEHELDAWLGGTEVTDEQRAALLVAAAEAEIAWPELPELREAGFAAAAQVILGDTTLAELGGALRAARAREAEAMAAVQQGVRTAVGAGMSESEAARVTGLSRTTVRQALGRSAW